MNKEYRIIEFRTGIDDWLELAETWQEDGKWKYVRLKLPQTINPFHATIYDNGDFERHIKKLRDNIDEYEKIFKIAINNTRLIIRGSTVTEDQKL